MVTDGVRTPPPSTTGSVPTGVCAWRDGTPARRTTPAECTAAGGTGFTPDNPEDFAGPRPSRLTMPDGIPASVYYVDNVSLTRSICAGATHRTNGAATYHPEDNTCRLPIRDGEHSEVIVDTYVIGEGEDFTTPDGVSVHVVSPDEELTRALCGANYNEETDTCDLAGPEGDFSRTAYRPEPEEPPEEYPTTIEFNLGEEPLEDEATDPAPVCTGDPAEIQPEIQPEPPAEYEATDEPAGPDTARFPSGNRRSLLGIYSSTNGPDRRGNTASRYRRG